MATLNRINDVYKMNKMINDNKNMDFNKMASNTIDNYANSATNNMNKMASNKINNVVNSGTNNLNNMNKMASNTIDSYSNSATNSIDNMNKMASNTIDNVTNSATNSIDNMNKMASNTIDNVTNSATNNFNNMNKMASNTINNVANSTTNSIDNMNKMTSNTIDNSSMSLEDKLKKASAVNAAEDRSNLGDITKFAHNIGQSIGEVSKVFVDTSAEVASIGINTSGNALEIEATATVNEANKLSQIAADLAKTKLPILINNVKDVTKVVTEGIGEVNNVIDNTTLEMKEAATTAQISTMMAARPGLTEEQARKELEEVIRLEREKEEIQKIQQFELEKAKIEAEINLNAKDKDKDKEAAAGGSRRNTLKHIQKGGKMAAKRTQKSIHDFLKPTITSSSILKIVKGGKKSIKKGGKKRRNNKRLTSKRRR
jgi:hypothetical protein